METGLIVYAIYVAVVVIWSVACGTSQATALSYATISVELLKEWESCGKNLIVIDLIRTPPARAASGTYCEPLSGTLSVSIAELHDVLRWIPPLTTLVFCCRGEVSRFDPNIEQHLLQAQINVVYWIVLPAAVSIPVKASPGDELDDSIFLARTGQPGWTPFHSSQQTDSRN